jgi:AbrB family looped-hinge helix DNA binding protein
MIQGESGMTIITTVTGKNQLTIPAAIVRELNLEPGTKVEWLVGADGQVTLRAVPSRYELAKRLEGILREALQPGDDPIGDLISERVEEDEEHL